MENIDCPICLAKNSSPYKTFRTDLDHSSFSLVKCRCSFIYLNPRPSKNNIKKYYDSNYLPHSAKKSLFKYFYSLAQKVTFYWKFYIIKRNVTQYQTVLDLGGGKGDFCNYLNKCNIKTSNYEPNLNKNVTLLDYKNENKTFDLIMLWHSLEHIHDLKETLDYCNQLLNPNGTVLIAIPNHNAIERKFFKNLWIAYDIPRHLYHFNYNSFKLLMDKYNFSIKAYYPMYQDTVFNIILSFKSYNFVKLLYILIYAFIKILIDNKKSSSILYICKKS